jgi:two-component system response regulator NreC
MRIDRRFYHGSVRRQWKRSRRKRPINILSDRELQVLRLVARYSSQQIGERILVGVKTVETYRSRLTQKLELRTRSDVVRFALQMGLLTPEMLEAEEGRPVR